MSAFWNSNTTQNEMTSSDSSDPTRWVYPEPGTVFDDGLHDITTSAHHFVGETKEGKYFNGVLTKPDGTVQDGEFSLNSSRLKQGKYLFRDRLYEGKFKSGKLNDPAGRITYKNGIVFEGMVENDRPKYGKGKFTIPAGIKVTFLKQTGELSMDGDNFVVTFTEGPYKSVSSKLFNLMETRFTRTGEVTVVFLDGCVFTGTATSAGLECICGLCRKEGFAENMKISSSQKSKSWSNEQLTTWIKNNPEFSHFSDAFVRSLKNNNVTSSHLQKFTDEMLKEYLGNSVHVMQFKMAYESLLAGSY